VLTLRNRLFSLFLCLSLSVCLSLSLCLSVSLFSVCLSLSLSLSLSLFSLLFLCLSLSVCLSVSVYLDLSVSLSLSLPPSLSLSPLSVCGHRQHSVEPGHAEPDDSGEQVCDRPDARLPGGLLQLLVRHHAPGDRPQPITREGDTGPMSDWTLYFECIDQLDNEMQLNTGGSGTYFTLCLSLV